MKGNDSKKLSINNTNLWANEWTIGWMGGEKWLTLKVNLVLILQNHVSCVLESRVEQTNRQLMPIECQDRDSHECSRVHSLRAGKSGPESDQRFRTHIQLAFKNQIFKH